MDNELLAGLTGVRIGHWTDLDAATGCTVVLCPEGAVGGVDVRGTAPATRETDLLDPVCMVQQVHAILIGGGSAYGLAAADGVMRWLAEHGYGFDVGVAKVPIVPAACLFDLAICRADVRPDAEAGYAACQAASTVAVAQGNVGAGAGATVGKLFGPGQAVKGGLGCATRSAVGGLIVSAVVAVNAFGSIVDPASNRIIAGPRLPDGGYSDTSALLAGMAASRFAGSQRTNTTLGVVLTNAILDKAGATKVAQMAQDGLARTVRPSHSHFDGDAIFTLSRGNAEADLTLVGALAADAVAEAVLNGLAAATALCDVPSARQNNQ